MKVWIWICSPLTFSTTILSAIGPFTPTSLGIKGAPSPRQGCTLGGRPHAPSQHGARADMFRGIRPDIGRETRFLTIDSISGGFFSQANPSSSFFCQSANRSRDWLGSSSRPLLDIDHLHLFLMIPAPKGYWPELRKDQQGRHSEFKGYWPEHRKDQQGRHSEPKGYWPELRKDQQDSTLWNPRAIDLSSGKTSKG